MVRQAAMQASHASAHIAHAALSAACIRHSAMVASHMAMQAFSIDSIAPMSMPMGRSIIRIVVSQTSAHIALIAAHRPMSAMPAI